MSADNFLGIVKIEDRFNTLYCGYDCWSECEEDCQKCGKIALFAVNTIEEAIEAAHEEMSNEIYEYGMKFINFNESLVNFDFNKKEKNKMIERCDDCGGVVELNWKFCPQCGLGVGRKINITQECTASLVKSKHSDGYYVSVNHNGKNILALGLDDKSKSIIRSNKYVFEKADRANVSFNIFKKG